MKTVVYTAISGGRDDLIERQNNLSGDFVAFVDEHVISGTWDVKKLESSWKESVRKAKEYKILPHNYFPEYEYSLWMDGTQELLVPVDYLVDTYLKDADLAVFKHPAGYDCAYKEAEVCIETGRGDPDTIRKQIDRYKKEGFPEKYGLTENTVLLRRHTPELNNLMDMWWDEIKNGSYRDQLSLQYVIWKSGFDRIAYFPGEVREYAHDYRQNGNRYFIYHEHVQ